jgi:hypothetical protein
MTLSNAVFSSRSISEHLRISNTQILGKFFENPFGHRRKHNMTAGLGHHPRQELHCTSGSRERTFLSRVQCRTPRPKPPRSSFTQFFTSHPWHLSSAISTTYAESCVLVHQASFPLSPTAEPMSPCATDL